MHVLSRRGHFSTPCAEQAGRQLDASAHHTFQCHEDDGFTLGGQRPHGNLLLPSYIFTSHTVIGTGKGGCSCPMVALQLIIQLLLTRHSCWRALGLCRERLHLLFSLHAHSGLWFPLYCRINMILAAFLHFFFFFATWHVGS